MTEAEWLACANPNMMLEFLRGRATDRKLRLFATGCCRLFWDAFQADATRTAIETNELFADGKATEKELSRARSEAHNAGWHARYQNVTEPISPGVFRHLGAVERSGVSEDSLKRLYFVAFMANAPDRLMADPMPMLRTDPVLNQVSPSLFRCVFGNPFRPVALDPAWLTSDVLTLARGIYDERAFDRMPILADALQDAGCDNEEVLTHCRNASQPHVRGCWVVDLVLGKS